MDGCVSAMLDAGCRFKRILMSTMSGGGGAPVHMDEHVKLAPSEIKAVASAYIEEMLAEGSPVISFPHLGRVIFEYDFALDEELYDDIEDEELATHTDAQEIGVTFFYYDNQSLGRKIKVSLSFWEEFVLKHCTSETAHQNLQRVVNLLESISSKALPSFGASNNEIHLNIDKSLDSLLESNVPYGNEYVLVGKSLREKLNFKLLDTESVPWREMSGGSVLVMFRDRQGSLAE